MRRTLLMIAAFALLLTQCRKPAVEFPTAGPANENMVSMTVTVGHGGKTDINGATGAIKWSAGDKLYVGDGEKYIGCLELEDGAGSATGTFSGKVSTTSSTTFGLYYLGSKDYTSYLNAGTSTTVDISFASQTGLRENLSDCHIGYGTATGKVEGESVILASTDPVTMTSKVAIAYFGFKKDDDSGYEGAITLSGDHIYNKMTVKFSGDESGMFTGKTVGDISLTDKESSQKYVMLVPPADVAEETLNFGGGATGTTKFYKGIEANKFYCLGESVPIAVTVTPWEPTWVDLGLPSGLLWATCNVGASKPEEYGDYYAWGEIEPYYADGHSQDNPCNTWRSMTTGAGNIDITNGYAWKTYSKGGTNSFVEWTAKPYDSDNLLLTSDHDAAVANWGGGWHMPTWTDFSELINNTEWSWTTESGVKGWKCENKSDATKYIFLPAAGYRDGKDLLYVGTYGNYWSSKLSGAMDDSGCRLYFSETAHEMSLHDRYKGYPVRAVRRPQK